MSGTTPYARPLKPAGGIEAVWLIPASDIVSATYGDGCCTGLTLRAGASADQWLILEQSSSFREENLNPDGPPRFRHTLTLVADPEEIRDRLGERQLARLATEGTVARIETASGVFLLARIRPRHRPSGNNNRQRLSGNPSGSLCFSNQYP